MREAQEMLVWSLGQEYPGGGNGNLLQYSGLENSMDNVAWWATVCGVTKSETQLSDWAQDLPYDPATPHLGSHPKELKTGTQIFMQNVHSTIIHSNQKRETSQVSINK